VATLSLIDDMTHISQLVPEFVLPAVSFDAPEPRPVALSDYFGRWLLVIFYPRDFSFVCPTELTSFSARAADFARRDCDLLGVSIDTIESHSSWLRTPVCEGGLGHLQFPLASDVDGAVARQFGVWIPDKEAAARGLFLIDPAGVLQYAAVHNLSVGRNVDETLRVLDAVQTGGLCPASWTNADGTIDPEQALRPGRVLGHYRIERLVGRGSFGTVFAAWDLRLRRRVALKVLRRNSEDSREAMLQEASAAAPLSHPNVCAIYAVDEEDGLPLIAMEFLDGQLLTDLIAARLPLDGRQRIARGIARGLAAAHALGTVHGDLKPANVIVGDDLTPRIMDFGLSRRSLQLASSAALGTSEPGDPLATAAEMTVGSSGGQSVITGTPAYMSPEQLSGDAATPASDVFAFGLLLFELSTAERALPDAHVGGILKRLDNPHLAAELAAAMPSAWRAVAESMLARDPARRPAMSEVLAQLEAAEF
jgi:eukaryotic-like serine/threonine-protein kinase